ncbi:MAG: Fe-S cluster assembly protein SufD [Hyphomonadaceae bacterium]
MIQAELPNRRVEAWKYSDLRAALGDRAPRLRPGRDVIERLAERTARIAVPAGAPVTIVERLDQDGLAATATDFDVQPGAELTRVVVQTANDAPLSVARVSLGAGAKFKQFVLAEGGKLARIETHVSIEGEGAEVELNGIYMTADGRHADLTSIVEHNVPGASTRQLIKGVAKKGGRGVFQGKIYVAHGAQKTDARQHHQALMLEEGGEIDAKPELEIYADDVQCAHGNAIGALDDAQLFYARSRGIPEEEARALLVEAFLTEAVPDYLAEEVRAEVIERIARWLR